MYAPTKQPDISVGTDKGVLRLQFSRKLSRQLYEPIPLILEM